MAFCDFCDCENCEAGSHWLSHAHTAGDRWICDVCWTYDMCTMDKNPYGAKRNPNGPCPSNEWCEHRPKLDGPWIPWTPPKA